MNGHRSLSPYNNQYTRITGKLPVTLNDCTLREGEQSALVNIRPEQKISIAKRLAAAGVKQIQVGYPGLSQSDLGVLKELKGSGLGVELEAVVLGYLPNWEQQIKASVESGADTVSIVYVTSKPRREEIFQATKDFIRERTRALIGTAKEGGLIVSFAPADTTRTEIDFVLEIAALAEEVGADRLFVADTLGAASPGAIRWLLEQVRTVCKLPIQIHVHNDFGLALANAIAAIEAGATIVDTTLNGWGDRTGNPPTEEVVATLELLYRNPVGIDLSAIAALAKEVAAELGVSIPATQPVTGSLAFAHKLETHVKAVLKHPPAFEPYDPVIVGGRRHVAVGQYSGPEAISARMASLGITIQEAALPSFVERVQTSARATNRVLNDEDLRSLAREAGL